MIMSASLHWHTAHRAMQGTHFQSQRSPQDDKATESHANYFAIPRMKSSGNSFWSLFNLQVRALYVKPHRHSTKFVYICMINDQSKESHQRLTVIEDSLATELFWTKTCDHQWPLIGLISARWNRGASNDCRETRQIIIQKYGWCPSSSGRSSGHGLADGLSIWSQVSPWWE